MSELAGGILSAIGRGGRIGTQTYLTQMEVERRAAEDAQRLNLALDKQDFLEKRVTREQLLEEMDRETADIRYQDKVKRIAEEREDQTAQMEFEHEQTMLEIEAKRNKPRTRQQEEGDMLRDRREQDPEFDRRYTDAMLKELEIKGQPKPVTQAGARTQKQDIVKGKKADVVSAARKVRSGDIKPPKGRTKDQPISDKDLLEWLKSQPETLEVDKPGLFTGDMNIPNPYGELGQQANYWGGSRASDSIQAALRNLPWSPSATNPSDTLPALPSKGTRSDLEKERDKLRGELGL